MKRKCLHLLATSRMWANTEKGETIIVKILDCLIILWLIDLVLLIVGSILK